MALIERLMGLETPKIPTHQFMAAYAEFKRSQMTSAQVIAAFNLTAAEQTEATNLLGVSTLTRADVHDVLMLAEQRIAPYTTAAAVRTRLGI